MDTIIRNARILTMDDDGTEFNRADLLVQGQKITALGKNLDIQPRDDLREIDGSGKLVMPGLINAHFHSPGNFLKGALDSLPLEIFMLYEVPPLSENAAGFSLNYLRTLLGAVEMLKLGVTSVHDDAYYVPVPTHDAIDGVMKAYVDSGIRTVATLDQPNVLEYEKYPYLYDLLPDDIRAEMANTPLMSSEDLLDCYRYLIDHWHQAGDGRIRAGVSVSAPQRVTVDYFNSISELSKRLDLPFNIHILETKLQRVLGEVKYRKSLVRYVHDLGLLDERMMVIHAIWTDEDDARLMADAGCSVAHNPVCNLKLGSGVMPWRMLRDHGINICLGSDEGCSDDTANMWYVGKTAGLVHTISEIDYNTWVKAPEVLWALIRGGAKAMRMDDKVGKIATGYQADLIMLDLNTIAFTPLNDLKRQLIYCENGSSVVMTMVAGQIVVENGRMVTLDEEALKEEIRELMPLAHSKMRHLSESARRLEPYYREMYLRCAKEDVGMQRRLIEPD
jgi:5-methylthioadenosine/S-adenosylhomocysteine deaminase